MQACRLARKQAGPEADVLQSVANSDGGCNMLQEESPCKQLLQWHSSNNSPKGQCQKRDTHTVAVCDRLSCNM